RGMLCHDRLDTTHPGEPVQVTSSRLSVEAASAAESLVIGRCASSQSARVALRHASTQTAPAPSPAPRPPRILDSMAEAADPLRALCGLPNPPRAGEDWAIFVQTVGNLRYSEWPSDLERSRLWYEPHLDRIHEDAEIRRADLVQLEQIASGYPSRERFLTELTLDPPDATSDQAGMPLLDEDYLILSTVHSAKGQEWKSVYV